MDLESPHFNVLFGDVLTGVSDLKPRPQSQILRPGKRSSADWHYFGEKAKRRRWPWTEMFISAAFHMLLIYGVTAPKKLALPVEKPTVELTLIDMSKLKPDLDDELQDSGEKPDSETSMDAPSIPDIAPSVVLNNAFIQAVDIATLAPSVSVTNKTLLTIPPNVRHGVGGSGSGMKDLFNMADLDRIPTALYRIAPRASPNLLSQSANNEVVIEFIVNKQGEVVSASVVKEPLHELGDLALRAVMRWKFRPGMKAGRVVNTRVRQPILFSIQTSDEADHDAAK